MQPLGTSTLKDTLCPTLCRSPAAQDAVRLHRAAATTKGSKEAGLTKMGIECEVIAPSLIPKRSGERITTDRRDAEKLAECYQSGTLTAVWAPDGKHEPLRDLVRARAAAKKDESRAKHRLTKYLLRYGL